MNDKLRRLLLICKVSLVRFLLRGLGREVLAYPASENDIGYVKLIREIDDKEAAKFLDRYIAAIIHFVPIGYGLDIKVIKNENGYTVVNVS